MTKEEEILGYLSKNVFDPILKSKTTSKETKAGVNLTIVRLKRLDAKGMIKYFWSAISGTDKSIAFSNRLKKEGLVRFEEVLEKFREKFTDQWLRI